MIWDGECGFCRYWILYWKSRTGDRVEYMPYQEAASRIPEIPIEEFKRASRFIETDGHIYSGPASAYKSISYFDNGKDWPINRYAKGGLFKWLSDAIYNHIAKNRSFYMKITRALFGKNPAQMKRHWLWYLLALILVLAILS